MSREQCNRSENSDIILPLNILQNCGYESYFRFQFYDQIEFRHIHACNGVYWPSKKYGLNAPSN